MTESLQDFLGGALTLSFLLAGVYFLRFWRKTGHRIFVSFAFAFWLLALNQLLIMVLGVSDERTAYVYLLRILGFLLILVAVIRANISSHPDDRPPF